MAEQDFTTKEWPSMEEINEVIGALRAIRAIGDLLCMAADTAGQHRATFREDTLAEVGVHLEDLTTEALVILRWENPKPQDPALQEGGA